MLWSFFYDYGFSYGMTPRIISYAGIVLAVFLCLKFARPTSLLQTLYYGTVWLITYALLDVVFVTPIAGFDALFTSHNGIGYSLLFLTPPVIFLYSKFRARKLPTEASDTAV